MHMLVGALMRDDKKLAALASKDFDENGMDGQSAFNFLNDSDHPEGKFNTIYSVLFFFSELKLKKH